MERPPMERAMSTDVIMDIVMSHLKVRDLIACRQVSKFWNKAASSVLRRRSTMTKNISHEIQLMELQECMRDSLDFPFAGLQFDRLLRLSYGEGKEFFRNFGEKFTKLSLDTPWVIKLENLAPFINLLPCLSILEVYWSSTPLPDVELLESPAAQEADKVLKISSVQTIRITTNFSRSKVNKDVLRQLCTAASPSLRIECVYATHEILEALESVGKLQALSVLNLAPVEDNEDYAVRVDELLSTQTPALTKLSFIAGGCISWNGFMKLLVSSQHTLKELRLDGICASQFTSESPVLAKLTTLSLSIDQFHEYVFQGSHGHKFPALKELQLDTIYEFPIENFSDGLFIVPSLTSIFFEGYVYKDIMDDLAGCFPNVLDIQLRHYMFDFEWSWDSDPTHIWSVGAFKLLEKLVIWDYTVQSPIKKLDYSNNRINFNKFKSVNMDSFLTGIPITICENLRQQAQQNLTNSPFNIILRDSPSILQLKNLKELIVSVKPQDALEELPEEPPFISMVSVWYALQMMPNLVARFVYEPSSLADNCREEERDKAVTVLKAAFKHVQPYVTLEPFYH